MIEDGDASFTDRHDRAVDVHETRFGFWRSHAFSSDLKARSQNNRCLSAFAIFLGSSIDGNKPKWMFIGAKSFWVWRRTGTVIRLRNRREISAAPLPCRSARHLSPRPVRTPRSRYSLQFLRADPQRKCADRVV